MILLPFIYYQYLILCNRITEKFSKKKNKKWVLVWLKVCSYGQWIVKIMIGKQFDRPPMVIRVSTGWIGRVKTNREGCQSEREWWTSHSVNAAAVVCHTLYPMRVFIIVLPFKGCLSPRCFEIGSTYLQITAVR